MIRQNIYKTVRYAVAIFAAGLCAPTIADAAPMYFYPAEPWMITQTDMSCRIRNQFNNGFVLTLEDKKNGLGQTPAEMNLNFRQPVFTIGQIYNVSLGFENQAPQQIQAKAKDTETLAIVLENYPSMLERFLQTPTFNLVIEGNDFNFSLVGLTQQAHNFKSCTGNISAQPAMATPVKPQMDTMPAQALPTERRQTQIVPNSLYDQISAQTGTTAKPYDKGASVAAGSLPKDLVSPPQKKPKAKKQSAFDALFADDEPLYEDDIAATESLPILNDSDWTLEKATMRYQEAERQLNALGQKLQKERAQCKIEKKELEALLFDPQLTSEQQLAKLSSLEEELKRAKVQMQNQKLQYEARIKILENQLSAF